jgi:hypothetical protein
MIPALFLLSVAGLLHAGEIDRLVSHAPQIKPQPDGVLYLNPDAAARIAWQGSQPQSMNQDGGQLKLADGHFTEWAGDTERPYWRIMVGQPGRYQVVINRSVAPGRESTAAIRFWQGIYSYSQPQGFLSPPPSETPNTETPLLPFPFPTLRTGHRLLQRLHLDF